VDNVTLGIVALVVSVIGFLLVNILSVQSWIEDKEDARYDSLERSPASSPSASRPEPATARLNR
jgi:hypothetical protein